MPHVRASSAAAESYPARTFVGRLVALNSALGLQLQANLATPLREYLRSLVPSRRAEPNEHLLRLTNGLRKVLFENGYGEMSALASEDFLRFPVMQLADHSNLLLDAETLLNNYLFGIACREAGVSTMIVSQCSTVSCLSRRAPVAGPVFLRTLEQTYSLFPFSKRFLKGASFCCLPGPLTLDPVVLEGARDSRSPILLNSLRGESGRDAPTLFRKCNDWLWERMQVSNVQRFAVDESLTSEVVAAHLDDEDSPISRMLFDPEVRDALVATKKQLVSSPANLAVNRSPPDFFWLRVKSRLWPLVLRGSGKEAFLSVEEQDWPLPMPFSRGAVSDALRSGVLYADRFLGYSVRGLLPGVVAVGGTSQQDYVELYRRLFLLTHAKVPFLSPDDEERIRRCQHSRLGGAPLVELDDRIGRIVHGFGEGATLDELEELLDLPIGRTIGELKCASYLFYPAAT